MGEWIRPKLWVHTGKIDTKGVIPFVALVDRDTDKTALALHPNLHAFAEATAWKELHSHEKISNLSDLIEIGQIAKYRGFLFPLARQVIFDGFVIGKDRKGNPKPVGLTKVQKDHLAVIAMGFKHILRESTSTIGPTFEFSEYSSGGNRYVQNLEHYVKRFERMSRKR